MLMKLSRDVYHIIPLSADPQTYSPDNRLAAKYMMKGKGYYIAYTSAMNIFGLRAQPGFKTMVVTNRQLKSPIKNIAGTDIEGYMATPLSKYSHPTILTRKVPAQKPDDLQYCF